MDAQSDSDFIVYADESGDHGMEQINPDYPVFVLSCCIFNKDKYVEIVCPELHRFKLRWWPHDAVVLHSAQIKRQTPPFAFLTSHEKRERFFADLSQTLATIPFVLICSAVHKQRLKEHSASPGNPYSLALQFCMERTYAFLRDHGQSTQNLHFLVERRGKKEDAELEVVFRRVCEGQNLWCPFPNFSIEFIDKKANLPGLQIADLVSTPVGRYVHRPHHTNRAFEVIRSKFRQSPEGQPDDYGFMIFP